jgi:Fe-S oxidoreductase
MPTYKAEFLHHHFRSLRRWRPRYAYAMGFIDQAARVASRMPEITNFVLHVPPFAQLMKAVGGIDQHRPAPWFAPMSLQQWVAQRGGTTNPYGRPVVLWPDTFNNHLHTQVGVACVEALEAAGWQVIMPEGHVCCGRPLYDYWFLDQAQRYMHRTLDVLREHVRAGTPVVGMEPSCLAVFKDELIKMLPHDDDARRLARNAYHFGEFFRAFEVAPPKLPAGVDTAMLWGHCHHRATGGVDTEEQVLEQMGAEVDNLKGGCCGLAGSWGFEQGKWQISLDCGEEALLPAVRDASEDTLIVANGFSCKTQIEHAPKTSRKALHLAEVMSLARTGSYDGRKPRPALPARITRTAVPVMLAAGLAAAGGLMASARRS